MNCEFCNKTFSSKSNLVSHQRSAKYCLDIQGKENKSFVCGFCTKTFSLNQTLQDHLQSCKEKKNQDNVKKEFSYFDIIRDKDSKIKLLEERLQKQIDEYEEKLEKQKNEYTDKITKLEIKLEKIEDAFIENSKKSSGNTTTNNTTHNNNIIVTNNSLNLNDKDAIDKIINEKLTQSYVCNGQQGLAKFAYDNILTDANGNPKYICVDSSRQNFEYVNDNGNVERDVKATKLKQALINSNVMRQAGNVGEKVWTKADGTVDNDRFEAFNGKVMEIMSVDKDDAKFRSELSKLTSQ